MSDELSIPLPDDILDEIAERVADLVVKRMEEVLKPRNVRWLNTREAAEYLGMTRGALYGKAAERSIPHYRVDRRLLFRKDEVDAWMEDHREAPRSADYLFGSAGRSTRRQARPRSPARKRDRPQPPPRGGSDEQKERWARELGISRAELDEMGPSDFDMAWRERNERLREAGVFDKLGELTDKLGWETVDKMAAPDLIDAVRRL